MDPEQPTRWHTADCLVQPKTDVDVFTVALEPGQHRAILSSITSSLDPRLRVLTDAQIVVGDETCDVFPESLAPHCTVQIEFPVSEAATYHLEVSDLAQAHSGFYVLQLERVPDPDPVDLIVDDFFVDFAAIAPRTDVDHFSVLLDQGDSLTLEIESIYADFDPRVELYGPDDGFETEASCDGGSSAAPADPCSATLEVVADAAGIYAFVVSDLGADETGTFYYRVTAVPAPALVTLQCGALAGCLGMARMRARRRRR